MFLPSAGDSRPLKKGAGAAHHHLPDAHHVADAGIRVDGHMVYLSVSASTPVGLRAVCQKFSSDKTRLPWARPQQTGQHRELPSRSSS